MSRVLLKNYVLQKSACSNQNHSSALFVSLYCNNLDQIVVNKKHANILQKRFKNLEIWKQ